MEDHINNLKPRFGQPLILADYARHHRIHVDDVWRLIDEGALMARCIGKQIYILENSKQLERMTLETRPVINQPANLNQKNSPRSDLEYEFKRWLNLGQATMDHMAKLNQDLVQAKDQLLEAKQQQLQSLNAEMKRQDKIILGLHQQIEDLETLTRALTSRAAAVGSPKNL